MLLLLLLVYQLSKKNEGIEQYQRERHSTRSVNTQSKIEPTQKKSAQAMPEQSNEKEQQQKYRTVQENAIQAGAQRERKKKSIQYE